MIYGIPEDERDAKNPVRLKVRLKRLPGPERV